jgi:hypothetical protein
MCQCNDACKPHGRPYISVLINHHQSKFLVRCVKCIKRNIWTSDWHASSLSKLFIACYKGLNIPKWTLKAVNRGTGNTVAKRKKEKTKQKTIYKTLHRKLRSSNTNPTRNDVCTQVLGISKSGSTCGIRRVAPFTNRW